MAEFKVNPSEYKSRTEKADMSSKSAGAVALGQSSRLGVSAGGYFIGLGVDSERYGSGMITILQGKNLVAKFSYVDWQKVDSFINEHSDFFNKQLDKELERVAAIKRR